MINKNVIDLPFIRGKGRRLKVMCNISGILFSAINLKKEEIEGKRVIEVGSLDVNGSLRPLIESYNPKEYIGIDIVKGPGVDRICKVENLVEEMGQNAFDIVVSTELLEHVKDWRKAISDIKGVCKKEGGIILITTRSIGFAYHGYLMTSGDLKWMT